MNANPLFGSFTATTASLEATASTLGNLQASLDAVAANATAEGERVAQLLAGLPAIPEGAADSPFARALGLDAALAGLHQAKQHLGNHIDGLGLLASTASGQAGQVGQVTAALLGVASQLVPQATPSAPLTCSQEAPALPSDTRPSLSDTCPPPSDTRCADSCAPERVSDKPSVGQVFSPATVEPVEPVALAPETGIPATACEPAGEVLVSTASNRPSTPAVPAPLTRLPEDAGEMVSVRCPDCGEKGNVERGRLGSANCAACSIEQARIVPFVEDAPEAEADAAPSTSKPRRSRSKAKGRSQP